MGSKAKSGAAMTSLVGEMNANFPFRGTRSQPSFIAVAALMPKQKLSCFAKRLHPPGHTHRQAQDTHAQNKDTSAAAEREMRRIGMSVSEHADTEEFSERGQGYSHDQGQAAAARAMVNFAATTFTCIP